MFMRSAGAFRFQLADLISHEYAALLARKHSEKRWGTDGKRHAAAVAALADQAKAETILDYGCGEQTLAAAMAPRKVLGFDPGMVGRDGMPKPCDVLACTDVLEHVEPEKLGNVLAHMHAICLKAAFLVISTRPAREVLPDGRNAHLIVRDAEWWTDQILAAGFTIERAELREKEAAFWLTR
jgi:2-polyprenyl-3-methyl-5-hydroxy-6-metoxy-1,4-benzoquinol methylase